VFDSLKKVFGHSAPPVAELPPVEQALRKWKIKYRKEADGSLVVPGDVNLIGKGLVELPDLSTVTVKGNFFCYNNMLTSLKGSPKSVGGFFSCMGNRLPSLEGVTQSIGKGLYCRDNWLTTLYGAPAEIGGDFDCDSNRLTSLEHAPRQKRGYFSCSNNQLTSLEHGPREVAFNFLCLRNPLESLAHAPETFKKLYSDFGEFKGSKGLPEHLRHAPEKPQVPVKAPNGLRL
jgi:hypothetical protein